MPKGAHQCLVFSLAMLLEEDVTVLLQELGHDGMVKVFDGPIPQCYNGHHIQEIIEICCERGHSLTPIEFFPRYASARNPSQWLPLYHADNAPARFRQLTRGKKGLLIGQYRDRGHAVAWDGNICFDPNGVKYPLSDFVPQECWLLDITSQKNHL